VYTISVVPNAAAPPSITDAAGVTANEPDPDTANNTASLVTDVFPVADVAIVSQGVSPIPAIEGVPVMITLTVANFGPSTATGVGVMEPLPAGLAFVSGSAPGGTVTVSGGIVSAPVGDLLDGTSATIMIFAMTTGTGMLTVNSTVTANETDPDTANNSASTTFDVSAQADLSVALSGSGLAYNNAVLTYTAVVTNNGPSPATNVLFADPLFAGASFVAIAADGVFGSVVNGVAEQPIGTLASGASVTVVLMVVPTEPGTVTNTAVVAADEPDPNMANNTSSVTTTVFVPQSLITFGSTNYEVGNNAGYATITIDRSGYFLDDVTVHFSTFGGDATPGLDYEPISETVDFPAGSTQAVVFVPLLDNPYDNKNVAVGLEIDSPTGTGVISPDASTSLLTIIDTNPLLVGPTVTALKLSGYVNSITSIELDFSDVLNPTTANNPLNYTLTAFGGPAKGALPQGTNVPVASATYNIATGSVTLVPAQALPANELFLVDVNGSRPGAVTDLAGNPLNSVFGVTPGSDYLLSVARGTDIVYPNENGDPVTLKLTGPGTIDIDRFLAGDLETLQVVGGVANKTVVTGTVHPTLQRSKIGSILGIGQFGSIRLKMTTPPFYVANLPYPNIETQVDAPAIDTLLPTPPPPPKPVKTKTVKAKVIKTTPKTTHAESVHEATVHAAKVPKAPAQHRR
jgi:uncharacterized repeat protein (TIGR01451 family)